MAYNNLESYPDAYGKAYLVRGVFWDNINKKRMPYNMWSHQGLEQTIIEVKKYHESALKMEAQHNPPEPIHTYEIWQRVG